MTNAEKAVLYDDLIRESDRLQRLISKLKSEYAPNIPAHIEKEINENNAKLSFIIGKVEDLLR